MTIPMNLSDPILDLNVPDATKQASVGMANRSTGWIRRMWRGATSNPSADGANRKANLAVVSRQVLRAKAREVAMHLVTKQLGGEPRAARRRIALARARNEWRPSAAKANA